MLLTIRIHKIIEKNLLLIYFLFCVIEPANFEDCSNVVGMKSVRNYVTNREWALLSTFCQEGNSTHFDHLVS